MMHPLVELARKTIEMHVREGRTPRPPEDLVASLKRRAGAFVSIHAHGQLRGCIGTIEPTQGNVVEEVIANAVSAATRDPRFPAITSPELPDLDIKVDILGEPEPVNGLDDLDPRRYGVIVQSSTDPWRRGLLLPDLEGVNTAEDQVAIARRKAWLRPGDPVQLYRFEVERYS
jgi:AmmeMemoRadiSam system protein A